MITVLLIDPGKPATTRTIERGILAMYELIGGHPEFLGIRSHTNGLDELSLVYNQDQSDDTLPLNRAAIRGRIVGIRCDDTGEMISVQRSDLDAFSDWLRSH